MIFGPTRVRWRLPRPGRDIPRKRLASSLLGRFCDVHATATKPPSVRPRRPCEKHPFAMALLLLCPKQECGRGISLQFRRWAAQDRPKTWQVAALMSTEKQMRAGIRRKGSS